jgi:hypothetical protein
MRGDELDTVSEIEGGIEKSKLIAAPSIFRCEIRRFRPVAAIGREGFESRIDGGEGVVIGADDRRKNRHGVLKIDADAPISQVHEDVGSGLQLGDVGQIKIDVPRSGAASGKNPGRPTFSRQ